MTGIVDYGLGNLFSLEKALTRHHIPFKVERDPDKLKNCDRYILAGVGNFGYGMSQLRANGLDHFLKEQTLSGKHLLGICLGMQLLGISSEESSEPGLGLLSSEVLRLQVERPFKIPHIGWNTVNDFEANPLFRAHDKNQRFYFTHSYAMKTSDFASGKTSYGNCTFVSAVHHQTIYGVQFHPEKSFDQGMRLLQNFAGL